MLLIFVGLYLLGAPRDMLAVRYQNMRLSMTGRPLKDEDFPKMGRYVSTMKLGGLVILVIGATVLAYAFMPR